MLKKILVLTILATAPLAFADGQAQLATDAQANNSSFVGAYQDFVQAQAATAASQAAQQVANADTAKAAYQYGQYGYYNGLYAQFSQPVYYPGTTTIDTLDTNYNLAQAAYFQQQAQNAYTAYQAYTAAAAQAQATANQQTALSTQLQQQQQTAQATQATSYTAEVSDAGQAQTDTATAANSQAQAGTQQGLSTVQSSTGVQQGQQSGLVSTMESDTGYLAAGAGAQTALNSMATDEATANVTAVQDAQIAAGCAASQNYPCAAAYTAANITEQNTANGLYATSTAAAPALGVVLNAASTADAVSKSSQVLQSIAASTGVAQGVQSNPQSLLTVTPITDTSYTHAADTQNAAQLSDATQQSAALPADLQAGYTGANAQAVVTTTQGISSVDTVQAQQAPTVQAQQAWTDAASTATLQGAPSTGVSATQTAIQQSSGNTESATSADMTTQGQQTAQTLNSAAKTSAVSTFNATMQQINSQVGQ